MFSSLSDRTQVYVSVLQARVRATGWCNDACSPPGCPFPLLVLAPGRVGCQPTQQVAPPLFWPRSCWSPQAISSHRTPPLTVPRELVINSLIIHHYSNHYLPSPGPQRRLRRIQSGSRVVPAPPPKPKHYRYPRPSFCSRIPGIDHTHLPSAVCR